jgi:hypothetical protein
MNTPDPANGDKPKLTPEQIETLKAQYLAEVLSKFQSFLNDSIGKPNGFKITVSGYRIPNGDRFAGLN